MASDSSSRADAVMESEQSSGRNGEASGTPGSGGQQENKISAQAEAANTGSKLRVRKRDEFEHLVSADKKLKIDDKQIQEIKKEDIDERTESKVSIMPLDLKGLFCTSTGVCSFPQIHHLEVT